MYADSISDKTRCSLPPRPPPHIHAATAPPVQALILRTSPSAYPSHSPASARAKHSRLRWIRDMGMERASVRALVGLHGGLAM